MWQSSSLAEGLTGSEIESVFIHALLLAFDRDRKPGDLDVARILADLAPLSKLMASKLPVLGVWFHMSLQSLDGGSVKLIFRTNGQTPPYRLK
ncbi:MAG: hypothetical protein ABSA47_16685 [Verrucomicrobiota bacterium]